LYYGFSNNRGIKNETEKQRANVLSKLPLPVRGEDKIRNDLIIDDDNIFINMNLIQKELYRKGLMNGINETKICQFY
jgi:hypothetical protein